MVKQRETYKKRSAKDGYKTCSKCEENKAVSEFHKSKANADGYNYYCKQCVKNYSKWKYANDPDYRAKIKNYNKQWVIDNRAHVNARAREYAAKRRATDPEYVERHRMYDRRALDRNPERRERNRIKSKEWYFEQGVAYKQKYNEQRRHRYANDPEFKQRVYVSILKRQRAMRGGDISLTGEQWETIIEQHEGRCVYCGCIPQVMTVDHVVPLSKGGAHNAYNVVPSCSSCNSSKNSKMPEKLQMKIPVLTDFEEL